MRLIKLILSMLLLLTVLSAKSLEGVYQINNLHGKKDGFSTWIEVKYKIWTLMDEPVVDAIVKYKIGDFIVLDGHTYEKEQIPDDVLNKLRIYDIELIAPLSLNYTASGLRIKLDTGVIASQNKWGFNAPESPSWDKFIFESLSDEYLIEKEAKDALSKLMNLYYEGSSSMTAKDGVNDNSYGQVRIKFDMTAMKEWANEYYYKNKHITKKEYNEVQKRIQNEKENIDNYIENKKYEVENKEEEYDKRKSQVGNVWVDEDTGLMWQDEEYSDEEMKNYHDEETYEKVGNWYYADEYCSELRLSNFDDWRLPTIEELEDLRDKRSNLKSGSVDKFRNVWSSTTKGSKRYNYAFNMYDEGDNPKGYHPTSWVLIIKCVRDIN